MPATRPPPPPAMAELEHSVIRERVTVGWSTPSVSHTVRASNRATEILLASTKHPLQCRAPL